MEINSLGRCMTWAHDEERGKVGGFFAKRAAAAACVPLEIVGVFGNIGDTAWKGVQLVAKPPAFVAKKIFSKSEKVQKAYDKIAGPKKFAETALKIIKFVAAIFTTLTLGFIVPGANKKILEKMGLVKEKVETTEDTDEAEKEGDEVPGDTFEEGKHLLVKYTEEQLEAVGKTFEEAKTAYKADKNEENKTARDEAKTAVRDAKTEINKRFELNKALAKEWFLDAKGRVEELEKKLPKDASDGDKETRVTDLEAAKADSKAAEERQAAIKEMGKEVKKEMSLHPTRSKTELKEKAKSTLPLLKGEVGKWVAGEMAKLKPADDDDKWAENLAAFKELKPEEYYIPPVE